MRYEWISFTTDYGLADAFVGTCHGVIARVAPEARVMDVTHGIPAGAIRQGAHTLAQAVPYLPGAVHCAVVDPGVGTARRGIVVVAAQGLLVGPDNGLLLPAATALGGAETAFELASSAYRLPEVSATFHGRDIFAPAAAHLATGIEPARFGPEVPLDRLERIDEPVARLDGGTLRTEPLTVDGFGNVQLAATGAQLAELGVRAGEPVAVTVHGSRHSAVRGGTFADAPVGDLVLLSDSAGHAALAVNGGSAAAQLGLDSAWASQECTVTVSPTETAPGVSTA
ncbi:SAM-dependent chlorinase/fluorinase [Haloechinothrix sp. YIM 98757]|uniref:SAM-dependent chlorinase/fluorinase n=1 Tax=Haloechinothrix aidingensis TaxID=2752311 RepID=A0A838AEI3_9PSEU|nr:SAM-dependent chlorinase/fluorinase [Haloechinothrix aidingensis]MBA0127538.1 SAM-dependent chlorinase/fluorinase [Haloechinothrix aidingensis]